MCKEKSMERHAFFRGIWRDEQWWSLNIIEYPWPPNDISHFSGILISLTPQKTSKNLEVSLEVSRVIETPTVAVIP